MPQIRVAAKALFIKNGKVLFVKQQLPTRVVYDLPGGKIEYAETAEEALTREVFEELHIKIKPGKLVGTWWFIRDSDKDQVVCVTYQCVFPNEEVKLLNNISSEKILETVWMSRKEIDKVSNQIPKSLFKLFQSIF